MINSVIIIINININCYSYYSFLVRVEGLHGLRVAAGVALAHRPLAIARDRGSALLQGLESYDKI